MFEVHNLSHGADSLTRAFDDQKPAVEFAEEYYRERADRVDERVEAGEMDVRLGEELLGRLTVVVLETRTFELDEWTMRASREIHRIG